MSPGCTESVSAKSSPTIARSSCSGFSADHAAWTAPTNEALGDEYSGERYWFWSVGWPRNALSAISAWLGGVYPATGSERDSEMAMSWVRTENGRARYTATSSATTMSGDSSSNRNPMRPRRDMARTRCRSSRRPR